MVLGGGEEGGFKLINFKQYRINSFYVVKTNFLFTKMKYKITSDPKLSHLMINCPVLDR